MKTKEFCKYLCAFTLLLGGALMTSCIEDGEETIALESGDATELILGSWKVVRSELYDPTTQLYHSEMPEDNMLDAIYTFEEQYVGELAVKGAEAEAFEWEVNGVRLVIENKVKKSTQYEIVSLGTSTMVLGSPSLRVIEGEAYIHHYILSKLSEDDKPSMEEVTGIPSDEKADENPEIGQSNTNIPNLNYTVETVDGYAIVRLDLTGIQDPETLEWLKLVGTGNYGQNVWVSVDGKPKGFTVYNSAAEEGQQSIKADLVFLVDNSGSMSDEANAIAAGISSWAEKLASSGLDIRFGCVGYNDGGDISGALDLSMATTIYDYLNRSGYTGTNRTVGFYGNNAEYLQNSRSEFDGVYGECGVVALRYADKLFAFRNNANRIYVNFTDEPNQPNYIEKWSVEIAKDKSIWPATKGTIHTVYSADTTFNESRLYYEKPWRLSQYTGGTVLKAPTNFSGVSLDKLPVTGAMQNSYIIRFTNVDEFMDGREHTVKITVLTRDGKVKAEKTFAIVFGTK